MTKYQINSINIFSLYLIKKFNHYYPNILRFDLQMNILTSFIH